MVTALSSYLTSIRDHLRLDPSSERDIMGELASHIEDRVQELKQSGLSEEEATSTCLRLLGSAKTVARQLYEAHSQGTWKQALMASLPHILFALLFVLNWWRGMGWLLAVLGLVLATVVYGWWHSKPTWFFPWLGYSLVPVAVAGLFLIYLPRGWSWLAIIFYIPLAAWLLYRITVQTIKRDWLYSSLMLLPVPVIVGWVLAMEAELGFSRYGLEHVQRFGPWIGTSFLALAIPVAVSVRLRQRWLKIAVLLISGLLTLLLVAYYTSGRFGLPAFLVLILVMVGLFLTPALLSRKLKHAAHQPPP
ncbi:MAG: permease prefix domain 1-containing protein [Chloroflexota bacterium]